MDGFQRITGGFSIGERNQEGRMLLECCGANHLCIASTWLRKADKKNIAFDSGCSKSENIFCVMENADRKFLLNVKVTTVAWQHSLEVDNVDKK